MSADGRARILLVDDEAANLAALEAVLAPLGQELVRAESGRDALRRLLRMDVAAIILDLRMPEMDGLETAALIRGRPRSETTPIIFVTAVDEVQASIGEAYAVGAVDFIFKPLVPEQLRAKLAVFVELHQRRQEVERLLAEAREVGRAKAEFLNMAAHELRTPLSVVAGYLSMLQDGTLGEPPAAWRRILDTLNVKANELNKIVDDLLTASRLDTASLPSQPGLVDLREVARRAVRRLGERAGPQEAEVVCELPDTPVEVHADPAQLDTIVDNLLRNALAYSRERPCVKVTVAGGRMAELSVRDRGIGIPPALRDRIFERFVRLDDPTLTRHPGTGLGLTISRELARRQGGSLVVSESEVGAGSTLTLRLPGASPAALPPARPAAPAGAGLEALADG